MSTLELELQRRGLLEALQMACQQTNLTLQQLLSIAFQAYVNAGEPAKATCVLPSSVDEANRMMLEAYRDLGVDTLSGEEAAELCLD